MYLFFSRVSKWEDFLEHASPPFIRLAIDSNESVISQKKVALCTKKLEKKYGVKYFPIPQRGGTALMDMFLQTVKDEYLDDNVKEEENLSNMSLPFDIGVRLSRSKIVREE